MTDDIPNIELNTGTKMPQLGFGTWRLQEGEETLNAVGEALKQGYRLIDTAKMYGNEKSVGQAVRNSGTPREEIFVTTKLLGSTQDYQEALSEFQSSLDTLRLDYIDLYLVHSPRVGDRKEIWRAMEEIYKSGKAKAVGVSNYAVRHLEELLEMKGLVPAVNQIEFHPFIYKDMLPIVELCQKNNIIIEAYSPLARGRFESVASVAAIAQRHAKTGGQIFLRWAIQRGTIPIPKSARSERIKENLGIFDFELSAEEMKTLDDLSNGGFIVGDPADIN